jgi:hypothetical protein
MLAFTLYLSERTAELKQQFPSITNDEIEVIVNIEWKHLSNNEKTKFIELSNDLENITTSLDEFLLTDDSKESSEDEDEVKELQISSFDSHDESHDKSHDKSHDESLDGCEGCKYDSPSQLDHMNHPGACLGYF